MLFSDAGKAVRFAEDEVRAMGRSATGVRGMKLQPGQRVISLLTAADESRSVLTATENASQAHPASAGARGMGAARRESSRSSAASATAS